VGNTSASESSGTRKRDRPTVKKLTGAADISDPGPVHGGLKVCGAMSQQNGEDGRGNQSTPQKFVRLVGYRDPNARTERGVAARRIPGKR
jgi:hypothetical protein